MSDITPTLPSALPPRFTVAVLIGVSGVAAIVGIGLGGTAVSIYTRRSGDKLAKQETIAQLERDAEIKQRSAQLKRNYSAPLWDASQTYDPDTTYTIEGTQQTTVPVLMGTEYDTAVCIGTMGPDGFIQDINHALCLGYQ